MHDRRRPLALLSLAAALFAVGLAFVQNIDSTGSNDVELAQMGVEGEGDIPLPLAAT